MSKKAWVIGVSLSTALLIVALLVDYELKRELPEGIYLGEREIGNLNRSEVTDLLVKEKAVFEDTEINIIGANEQVHKFHPKDLGIAFQQEETLTKIFKDTHWLIKTIFAESDSTQKNVYKPLIKVDEQALHHQIELALLSHEKDFENAHVQWNEGNWGIVPEVPGLILSEGEITRIAEDIRTQLYPYQENLQLMAQYEAVEAHRKSADMEPLLQQAEALVGEPIFWRYQYDEGVFDLKSDPQWLLIDEIQRTVTLNEAYLEIKIAEFAIQHDKDPGTVTISSIEEKTSEYDGKIFKKAVYDGRFDHGRKANQEKLLADMKQLLIDLPKKRKINVEWETLNPTIISQVEGVDFPQILSTGISSYRLGNDPNRVKNIKLSLESFQGVVIDPGEEVSFNRVTGWITPRKGYTKTKIINEGKVEEGIGGGVCQSSTTLYRSILNAGLPVTERRNHTLDVAYYHAYGYGLDATVYTDARSDLRFKNDFPGPILVNVYFDDRAYEAHVEFYGTTDHREVKLTNIPTGNYLYKRWEWKIIWPDREEVREVKSIYQVEKKDEEEKEANPLEA